MCMIDYANDGDWQCLSAPRMVKARKDHHCGECHRTISKGETYEHGRFVDDYGFPVVRTCAHCVAVRSWLVVQCGGWLYEGVLEDLAEHWQENWECRGRYLALAI